MGKPQDNDEGRTMKDERKASHKEQEARTKGRLAEIDDQSRNVL
jgi:hypothetical protein